MEFDLAMKMIHPHQAAFLMRWNEHIAGQKS
jgi:penicillin-binding protein-related factor A (putative recombinase)